MESNWAGEHLQVIRTLMERSAVYRRALAPIMILNGVVGLVAAIIGWVVGIDSTRVFIFYWSAAAAMAMAGSFLLVRRQAMKDSEPFWSPPTRRVTQAMLPALVAGGITSGILLLNASTGTQTVDPLLPCCWIILYGCAFHAAGFFLPRGMRLFGWAFVLAGCGLVALCLPLESHAREYAFGVMGAFFGVMHLAYGVYLYFTERRKNES